MEIFYNQNQFKEIANINLAKCNIVYCEDNIFILDCELERNEFIKSLAYDIASNCDWCYPDIDNISTYIYIDISGKNKKCSLSIEVKPMKLSDADIDGLVITEEVVRAANDFYNQPNYICENIKIYPILITDSEVKGFVLLELNVDNSLFI